MIFNLKKRKLKYIYSSFTNKICRSDVFASLNFATQIILYERNGFWASIEEYKKLRIIPLLKTRVGAAKIQTGKKNYHWQILLKKLENISFSDHIL